MFALKHQQVIVLIKEDHLVQCGLLTSLLENNSQLLMTESAVTLLKALQAMLGVLGVPHEVKLIQGHLRQGYLVKAKVLVLSNERLLTIRRHDKLQQR